VAIDMDNMLAGFSSQVISATGGELDFGGGAATATIAACILRAEDILDVGFVVTEVMTAASAAINIGRDVTSLDVDYFVDNYTLTNSVAVGTVFRTSDGTLDWASTANTEAERSCSIGTTITILAATGGGTGKIVPFVIMRPQGPLDPIA